MRDFLTRRLLSLVVATVLLAATVFGATSCGKNNGGEETTTPAAVTTTAPDQSSNVVGEGETAFTFEVTFADGTTKSYTVKTNAKTVGEALLSVNLIAGEDSTFGLYVKTVDGVTLDWDKDQKYWGFYINGEYAQTGVDSTDVVAGATYAFRAE